MGSFVFRWAHPATDVFVTGTFDDWSKSEKLKKVGDHFEKNVQLANASEKIYYKFVVDGNWVIDHTAPRETDVHGNENNVLTPERIVKGESIATAIMSSAAPESTTAALAADAPLEKKEESSDLPGTFPETPAAELDKAAGEFGVNPLPAADGAVNPIQLAPGEKIPEGIAAENTNSHVKLDPESYEKSDALPGGAPVILSSVAPESTTAALAAEAPIETKVPAIVKESQEKAEAEPEASAVPEEVKEKANVESELLDKVKEAPSTSEGTAGKGTEKTENVVTPGEAAASVAAAATATAAAVGAAAVAGAVHAKDIAVEKATEAAAAAQTSATEAAAKLPESVKENLPESVQNAIATTSKEETREEVSPEVPAEVKESIIEANESPEAAANTEAVEEKKEVEAELLKEVKPVEAVGEPASEPAKESVPEAAPVAVAAPVVVSEATPEAAPKAAPEAAVEATPAAAAEAQPTAATTNGVQAAATTDKAADATPPQSTTDKPAESPTATEKKKKNRLSVIFGKVKEKFARK
ncbi:hypothetical protein F4775DRAFT_589293 [Biscogniauxia sp. FL1348]|nr:hypothetical protein F4775DRAFT_589293 [Biscogniauxia sp. FL1348]